MRVRPFLLLLAVLPVPGMQRPQVRDAVELEQESHHHLLFKNDKVRVWRMELAGRESAAAHIHRYDYVGINLDDAELSQQPRYGNGPEGPESSHQFAAGELWYVHGGYAHTLRNNRGLDRVRQIYVEVLHPAVTGNALKDYIDDYYESQRVNPPPVADADYAQEAYFFRTFLTRQQLLPGSTSARRQWDYDHVVIALTDLKLRNEIGGRPAQTVEMKQGEVRWVEGGYAHRLTNEGKSAARFATVELR
ncbi:MAG: hypothetical protein HYX26_03265 [Acidobacteriales bacterium]|nr:hypothetical protein [Terriglobales bacterium]